MQLTTPDTLRGRISALSMMATSGGPKLGDMEAAAVAALTSVQFSVVSGGVLCLLGLFFVLRRFPQLASYDAFAVAAGHRPAAEPRSPVAH